MYCAKTATFHQHALIGYIGSSPPAAGSYTSTAVFREATKVFYVGGNYKASAPASGRLWLNKNTDAYSNYTVDNGGQVNATITVSPPETELQYHQRAQADAASIKEPEPLEQATNFCLRAVLDHGMNVTVKQMFKMLVDEALHTDVDILWFAGTTLLQSTQTDSPPTKKKGLLKIFLEANDGRVMNTTFDAAYVVFKVAGLLPGAEMKLFGILGPPALRCTEAYFWLTGELGGELGQLLREKFVLPNADIAGAWTLEREAPIRCVNFTKGCKSTPLPILVDSCTDTKCNISRSDGLWQLEHEITRSGDRWSADFEDIAITCTDKQNVDHNNVAQIGLDFSVTAAEKGITRPPAKSVGGYYTVQAASNPPDCLGDASAIWLLQGDR